MVIILILFILAAVCFLLAAANAPVPRVNLVALGLLLMTVAFALGAAR